MSIRDLKEKYGQGKGAQLINRAIRAELIAGDHVLNASALLIQAAHKLEVRGFPGAEACRAAHENIEPLRKSMVAEIAARYGMKET